MSIATTTPEAAHPAFDVERVRADFLILHQLVRGKPLVYFDNAASSQKPRAVIDAIKHYYENDHANVHRGVHALSERATELYEEARVKVQKFIGAPCLRDLIFTRGTTEAINLVAQTFGRMNVHAGDEVIVSALEHHSNIVPWQVLCWEKHANLRVIPVNDAGELDLAALEKMINPATKIISIAHVSNALGTINPVKKIIELAHQHGVYVVVDGAQAVPHLRIDVRELDCDFYAFSGHKVYGPTGIGGLYGKPRHLELMPPYQTGGDMISYVSFAKTTWNELPYKFEAGTPNIAGAIGLAAAVDYVEDLEQSFLRIAGGSPAPLVLRPNKTDELPAPRPVAEHEHCLLTHATERVAAIPGVRIIGTAKEKAGVLSFVVEGMSALDVGTQLDLEGIAVRTGHHCCQPLMERFGIAGTVRASFAIYNTLDEVDVFADALEKIAASVKPRIAVPEMRQFQYAPATGANPIAVAEELASDFEILDEWKDRYEYIMDLGKKLAPMPDVLKTEPNRVKRCQSTVFMHLRIRPGTIDIVEFLADSDATIVRGELALLEKLFCGQRAVEIVAFDIHGFMERIGLEQHLSPGRRTGLSEMIARVKHFAAQVTQQSVP
ncbi:MAG: aminotransferase class V-fold PLP-dependent enzyme [Planctomycetes bacterium]|nr:aminotransferase class V-fold PLP-dependent enzyme [Planctomycetota bacterium]